MGRVGGGECKGGKGQTMLLLYRADIMISADVCAISAYVALTLSCINILSILLCK